MRYLIMYGVNVPQMFAASEIIEVDSAEEALAIAQEKAWTEAENTKDLLSFDDFTSECGVPQDEAYYNYLKSVIFYEVYESI